MKVKVQIKHSAELPEWTDCQDAVGCGEATALEKFIYDYEPGGAGPSADFRELLLQAIRDERVEAVRGAYQCIGIDVDRSMAEERTGRNEG